MGPVGRIASRLADGQWMIAGGTGNAESMVKPADDFDTEGLREGDEVILDPTQK